MKRVITMKSVLVCNPNASLRQLMQDNQKAVHAYNMSALLHTQRIVCICLLAAIIIGTFLDTFRPCIPGYATTLILCFGIAKLFHRQHWQKYTLHGLYLMVAVLALITFYISLVMFPYRPTAIACMFFGFIPMLFIDRPIRYYSLLGLLYLLYGILVLWCKGSETGGVDAVNALISAFAGTFLGLLFLRSRLGFFEAQRQLFREKTTDVLTGLGNRRKLYELISAIQTGEKARPSGLLMLDIDLFKHFNDTYGHAAGDTCLHGLGRLLTAMEAEFHAGFYRYGGEEFVGLLWDCDSAALEQIAEAIRLNVQTIAVTGPHMTVSIGTLYGQDADTADVEKWLNFADQALYAARENGRNQVVCWHPEI